MEAIVLAGGRGTRLAPVVNAVPKVLAPIGGRPFLELLLHRLSEKGMKRVILSVGYLASQIQDHFGDRFERLQLSYCVEDEPLGTGGATMKAMKLAAENNVFVMNGDTVAEIDYASMIEQHIEAGAAASLAVVAVTDCSRFGRLVLEGGRISGFAEKGQTGPGMISAGVYVLNHDVFARFDLQPRFSIETDFFVEHIQALQPLAFLASGYFVDIGIPEDFARAQRELL